MFFSNTTRNRIWSENQEVDKYCIVFIYIVGDVLQKEMHACAELSYNLVKVECILRNSNLINLTHRS